MQRNQNLNMLHHRRLTVHISLIAVRKGFLIPDYQQQGSKEITEGGGISEQ